MRPDGSQAGQKGPNATPGQVIALATTPLEPPPQQADFATEGPDRSAVHRHAVVAPMTANGRAHIRADYRDGIVHARAWCRSMLRPLLRGLFYTLIFISVRARADEPLFGYVYTTDLLPQGKYEVAQWATWRAKKPIGQYEVLEGRTELEYGLSDRLQVSAYFNYEWARAYHNNVINGTTLAPTPLANQYVGPDERLNTTRFTGFSLEAIYRIWSPYTDPVGLAVYLRPTVGPSLRELESRLIAQKNFRDDRLVLALNIGLIDDRQHLPNAAGETSKDIHDHPWNETSSLNLGLASSYRFATGWSAGMELQNERAFSAVTPFGSGARTNVAYYFGPSIHYADQHMFVTATYLDQLPFASDYAHTSPDFVVGGRLYSGNAEHYRVRVKFGWYF